MDNLILKAALGLLFLLVVLGLVLFLSAGSLGYTQAWIYLFVFGACVVAITIFLAQHDRELLAGRVSTVPSAESQKAQQFIAGLANLFFLGLFIVPGLDYRFGWSQVPWVVSWLASGVVVLSFYIIYLVFRENSYTRGVIEVTAEQRVITTGPYRLVRHPMYAGAMPLLVCTPLALGSWVGVPFALPVILSVVWRLLEEEKYLQDKLPGYVAYCEQVHYRLIPGIW